MNTQWHSSFNFFFFLFYYAVHLGKVIKCIVIDINELFREYIWVTFICSLYIHTLLHMQCSYKFMIITDFLLSVIMSRYTIMTDIFIMLVSVVFLGILQALIFLLLVSFSYTLYEKILMTWQIILQEQVHKFQLTASQESASSPYVYLAKLLSS